VRQGVLASVIALSSLLGLAKPAAAQALDGIGTDTLEAAKEANVSVVDLLGAMATTELPARAYLLSVGELVPPSPPAPVPVPNAAIERRLDCIQAYESRGYAGAVNRSSGASGLFQFLPSTWRTTPQGRAGLSVFDPVAARSAARWMLEQGRACEWVPVQRGLC
jgi:hypothetical protein